MLDRRMSGGIASAVLIAVLAMPASSRPSCRASGAAAQELQDALDRQIHMSAASLFDIPGRTVPAGGIHPNLVKFYHRRDMQPLWTEAGGPTPLAETVRSVLAAADVHGLNPADYAVDQIERYWDKTDVKRLARLELLLTLGIVDYISDLAEGRRRPRLIDPEHFPTARDTDVDPVAIIERCLACTDLRSYLEDQAPPFVQYRELRKKLNWYRFLAAGGGWPQVPPGPSLKPGQKSPRVSAVRRRLISGGEFALILDPDAGITDPFAYDIALVDAVKRFQRRHGLETDGIIGPATLAALNVTAQMRVRQIIANMECWRWVARDPGEQMLVVNIPSFDLKCLRREKLELTMSVIVGEQFHMTPVFTDKVRFVEINPYWDVPRKIAANEFLPKLKEDAQFLTKQHIRMFEGAAGEKEVDTTAVEWAKFTPDDMDRYHFRQDFGADNALGYLAFMFPNQFAVYLHDTPAKTLFDLPKRTFSHGCIRVSKALDLAVYLLGGADKNWGPDQIRQEIGKNENRVVHLERPVPIYVMYNTAVADPETHEMYFYEDVYGRDALLERALFD